MQWPWRRGGSRPATEEEPPDAPRHPATSAPDDAWRTLPALQRSVPDLLPVTAVDRFARSLAAHHDPSFLEPPGHLRHAAAPGGTAAGLATPLAQQPYSARDD